MLMATYAIGPRATPTVDDDRVYVLGATGMLLCLDVESGAVRWQKDYVSDYASSVPIWGTASAPIVDGDLLIAVVGAEPDGMVMAFDKRTGEGVVRWGTAFMVQHDDRYFLNSDGGHLIIARFTPDGYEELSRTKLIEPTTSAGFGAARRFDRIVNWSHPAYANRNIVHRNDRESIRASLAAADYR
jgi:outer membrane protein assembly factor BamB